MSKIGCGPVTMGFCITCNARAKFRVSNLNDPNNRVTFCKDCAEMVGELLVCEAHGVDGAWLAEQIDEYQAEVYGWDEGHTGEVDR